MVEPTYIVGVPGMGNSDPSWHQRRPYGFSRNGYGRAQARSHAYRRPSTASGRLSSAATSSHCPAPPKALAIEYWKPDYDSTNIRDNNDVARGGGYWQQEDISQWPREVRGVPVRARPLSAGCRPASSSRTAPAAPASSAVEKCTRNRAGIVRGGGRDGRAAPPPTIPPPRSPSHPCVAAYPTATQYQNQHQHQHQHQHQVQQQVQQRQHQQQHHHHQNQPQYQHKQCQQHHEPTAGGADAAFSKRGSPGLPPHCRVRRRPATAGAERSPSVAAEDEWYIRYGHEHATGAPAEGIIDDGAVSMSSGFRGVGEIDVAQERRASEKGDDGLSLLPPRTGGDQDTDHTDCLATAPAESPERSPKGTIDLSPSAAGTPPDNVSSPSRSRRAVYNRDSRLVAAGEAGDRRRHPTSAAPPRSMTTHACDARSDGGGGGDFRTGGIDGVWGADISRGRPQTRGGGRGVQRPRSASATTESRARGIDAGGGGGGGSGEWLPGVGDSALRSASAAGGRASSAVSCRSRPQSASSAPLTVVPSFVVSEKQVLRFFGHLTEELDWGCPRSPMEERTGICSSPILKIRQVVLHLYLSDGSLEILEKRQVNSGQQGGLLLKRNLFKKRDGSLYGASDLKVGSELRLLGRSYRLTGCDDFTRKWYETNGFEQPAAQQAPKEAGQSLRVEQTTGLCNKPRRPQSAPSGRPPSAGRSALGSHTLRRTRQQQFERLLVAEPGQKSSLVSSQMSLGLERRREEPGTLKRPMVKRFFRHNKETLRFKAVWDEPSSGGTRRCYDLLLFLEDETITLLNPREERRNSGNDEGVVHVRRQRIPKDWANRTDIHSGGEAGASRVCGGNGGGGDRFIGELDLAVGRMVHIWGRKMRLVGCDPFTRAYYRREHGIEMAASYDEAASGTSRHRARRTYHPASGSHRSAGGVPTAAGVGTDYLTLNLGRYEGAAPAGALPADRYRGHRIRCKAVLRSQLPNDKGREFVITYDLALHTLMVYELQRRNSGRPGGLFLVKGRHRHPGKNNRYYAPQDLFLGAVVPLVTGHKLVVTEMDRSSLKLCEENPREFPLMDYRRVLGRVAQRAGNMRLDLRSELRRRATGASRRSVSPFRASSSDGAGSSAGNTLTPTFPATREANAANTSSWTARKVFTHRTSTGNGNGNCTGRSGNLRLTQPGQGSANPESIGRGDERAGVSAGRRTRSGGAWGLVGGWGDRYVDTSAQAVKAAANQGVTEDGRGGRSIHGGDDYGLHRRAKARGNRKNESATAPWAAVKAAGVNVFASCSGQMMLQPPMTAGEGASVGKMISDGDGDGGGEFDDPCSFRGHVEFRDAMDDLGLLVGLGPQEVLTLVRAFTGTRGGRVDWASMCDRLSEIGEAAAGAAVAKDAAVTQDGGETPGAIDTVGGIRAAAATSHRCLVPQDDDSSLLWRMRRAGVAWRSVFACVRNDMAKGGPGSFLGVASLVTAMRRSGLSVGAGDAAYLTRRFARGGGSKVDYNQLCDNIYPCDFSSTTYTTEGYGGRQASASSFACSTQHGPSADIHHYCSGGTATATKTRPTSAAAGDRACAHPASCPPYPSRVGGDGHKESRGQTHAPSCGFDLSSGSGGGEGQGSTSGSSGVIDGSDGGGHWSLWDRRYRDPQQQRISFCRDGGDGGTRFGREEAASEGGGGSSRCWDEENGEGFL